MFGPRYEKAKSNSEFKLVKANYDFFMWIVIVSEKFDEIFSFDRSNILFTYQSISLWFSGGFLFQTMEYKLELC